MCDPNACVVTGQVVPRGRGRPSAAHRSGGSWWPSQMHNCVCVCVCAPSLCVMHVERYTCIWHSNNTTPQPPRTLAFTHTPTTTRDRRTTRIAVRSKVQAKLRATSVWVGDGDHTSQSVVQLVCARVCCYYIRTVLHCLPQHQIFLQRFPRPQIRAGAVGCMQLAGPQRRPVLAQGASQ